MSIHERRARLSAIIGTMTHVFILLSLFLPFSYVTTSFPPGFYQTSGWAIFSPPATLFELFALAIIFGPLLLYLGSVWLLFQQKQRWVMVLGSGAIGGTILTFLGFASFFPVLLLTTIQGSEISIVLGPAFWLSISAFLISFCCSLLLAISLFRMRSIIHPTESRLIT